ncbi:uncharacterized protein K489DRAFT_420762 [Dissoconium aciculare CBS 342.82]|uniref:Uncharacterized protein n=1 Tax=Dissoconium aciculare CBS 342.82 TaxID=1314786 RepID=A0A6J3LRE5_9PEZI|nr:uncharacterized protein K489DRAFT_420762 [Dissoconium aciculare CBS 342.82]KAF1817849.1 hypothetical protein K489DRAFT_420762 [Dissoconium aciculare CBS 342.82]
MAPLRKPRDVHTISPRIVGRKPRARRHGVLVELSWQKRRVLVAAGSVRNTPDDGEGDDDDKEMMMQLVSDEVMPRDRTRTRPNTPAPRYALSGEGVSHASGGMCCAVCACGVLERCITAPLTDQGPFLLNSYSDLMGGAQVPPAASFPPERSLDIPSGSGRETKTRPGRHDLFDDDDDYRIGRKATFLSPVFGASRRIRRDWQQQQQRQQRWRLYFFLILAFRLA